MRHVSCRVSSCCAVGSAQKTVLTFFSAFQFEDDAAFEMSVSAIIERYVRRAFPMS